MLALSTVMFKRTCWVPSIMKSFCPVTVIVCGVVPLSVPSTSRVGETVPSSKSSEARVSVTSLFVVVLSGRLARRTVRVALSPDSDEALSVITTRMPAVSLSRFWRLWLIALRALYCTSVVDCTATVSLTD